MCQAMGRKKGDVTSDKGECSMSSYAWSGSSPDLQVLSRTPPEEQQTVAVSVGFFKRIHLKSKQGHEKFPMHVCNCTMLETPQQFPPLSIDNLHLGDEHKRIMSKAKQAVDRMGTVEKKR